MTTDDPDELGRHGQELYDAVTAVWELDQHEMSLLLEAARTLDDLAALRAIVAAEGHVVAGSHGPKAHPALTEARQTRLAYARILAALRLPDGVEGDESQGRRSQRRVGARGIYRVS